jgi:hypothetical protein
MKLTIIKSALEGTREIKEAQMKDIPRIRCGDWSTGEMTATLLNNEETERIEPPKQIKEHTTSRVEHIQLTLYPRWDIELSQERTLTRPK